MSVSSAPTTFVDRHIGARQEADVSAMLKAVGYDTGDSLGDTAVPKDIRQDTAPRRQDAWREFEFLGKRGKPATKKKTPAQLIGQAY